MKTFKGKAIYNPSGKAAEYSQWACNFYTGCSNNCQYCYCKRGVMSSTWSTTPKLKACFKDEKHALEVFEKELRANLPELQKHGLFFSFTTDPFLPETIELTGAAVNICVFNDIPVKILTKRADWVKTLLKTWEKIRSSIVPSTWQYKKYIAFGFTLTGKDELEPNASTNAERIAAMRKLHEAGFKTWASIEPVIDTKKSLDMIEKCAKYCDLFKIGLLSGKKYDAIDLEWFTDWVVSLGKQYNAKIYFKNSLLAQAGINREDLPANCVGMDYNMFND